MPDKSTLSDEFFAAVKPTRLTVFIGAYGSGKSEISVNYALALRETGRPVIIADLDIINPYFRSTDARKLLEHNDVELLKTIYANTNVDVPAVPASVFGLFDRKDRYGVMDIGGEDLGARVLGSLRNRFPAAESPDHASVYMVVNANRPFTATAAQVREIADMLSAASGLSISGLVNNTNLLEFSDASMLLEADAMIKEASRLTGIPLSFAAARDDRVPAEWGSHLPDGLPLLRLQRSIFYPTE